jgi:O-antigen/teichoic acid export membrane protein
MALPHAITVPADAPAESLRARLQRGVSWNLAGAVFTSGCNFAIAVAAARILGREEFGEYGMVQNTAVTLSAMAQLATGYTATKYVAEFRAVDKARTGRIIGVCSLVAASTAVLAAMALIAAAPWLASTTLKAPHLATALMVSSAFVAFSTLNGYQSGSLAGLESYGAMARALIVASAVNALLAIGGAWWWGIPGLLGGLGAGATVQWLIFRTTLVAACAKRGIAIVYRGAWRERAIILRFAVPASLSGIVSAIAAWAASAVLARQSAGYGQLGLFNAANTMRSLILFLPLLLNRVSMSLLNHEYGRRDAGRFRKLFLANFGMTLGLILVGVAGVAAAGPWIMRAFGSAFAVGYSVLLVVLVATLFEGLAQVPYQIIQSHARMWQGTLLAALPRDASLVVLAFLLVPRFGAVGLAGAAAIAHAIALAAMALLASRIGLEPKPSSQPAILVP